ITATVLIRDSRWISNATVNMYDYYGGGGAIFVRGGNVHVERSRFLDNRSRHFAPSQIGVAGDQLWITGTTFERGLGPAYIHILSGTLVASDTVITGSRPITTPTIDGNAFKIGFFIYGNLVGEASAQIANTRVSSVTYEALSVQRCSYAFVRDSVFMRNALGIRVQQNCGGNRGLVEAINLVIQEGEQSGIASEGGNVVLTNTAILSHPFRSGIVGAGNFHLTDVLIANNVNVRSDERVGGGMYIWNGNVFLTNTQLISNYAPLGGGGIYLGQGALRANNVAVL
ncbi:MAG: hypothetical protein NZ781_13155, partial [Armatimonadetes bacterium]|nr:hypothetical protein [Armatimonadota bacterium]